MTKNRLNPKRQSGFTIVELLIVIVVIAILAAITIVAYGGITARANTASSASTAEAVAKKAEAYNADPPAGVSGYPTTMAALTGAASTTTYFISSTSAVNVASTAMSAAPAKPNYVNFYVCGTGATTPAPTTLVGITTKTGNQIGYWNYSTSTLNFDTAGQASGQVGIYYVGCVITTTS